MYNSFQIWEINSSLRVLHVKPLMKTSNLVYDFHAERKVMYEDGFVREHEKIDQAKLKRFDILHTSSTQEFNVDGFLPLTVKEGDILWFSAPETQIDGYMQYVYPRMI